MPLATRHPLLLIDRPRAGSRVDLADAPGPIGPVLSTLPGLFCWLLFASAAMPGELPILERFSFMFGSRAAGGVMLIAWFAAAACSIAALIVYGKRPQLWHTTLCLGLHLAGLLFSVLLLGGLALWAIF